VVVYARNGSVNYPAVSKTMSRMNNRILGRRAVLRQSIAALVTHALPVSTLANARPFFARTGLPIGLQLYTLGEIANSDLDGSLTKVARIGFKTIELAGFRTDQPTSIRAAADHAGLHITSVHLGSVAGDGYPGLGDDPGQLAASIHTLGATVVVLPGPLLRYSGDKPLPATLDDWKRTAAFLNERGGALRREGLLLGYHNHNPEFAPVEGTTGFEVIARETDRKLVTLEMDAGWVRAAGLDPVALLNRYAGRFRLMHVKDISASTHVNFEWSMESTEVGHGIIDWPRVIAAAYKAGVTQYFVEQEPPSMKDRFASIADSFAFLSSMP
jgi:sugar phosphate isomerase/epimerase